MQINELVDENKKLKTNVVQLKRELQKYEQIDENLINSQKLLNRHSEQQSLIPTLKYKIRIQANEIDSLKQQLYEMSRQAKVTQINELECQLTEYQEETQNLRGMLNEALRLPQENKANKFLTYLQRIEELKQECRQEIQLKEKVEREFRQQQSQLKKSHDLNNQLSNEKQQLQQKMSESILLLQQQIQNQQPQVKDEQDNNKLQQQLNDKDRLIFELNEQIRIMKKDTNIKLNSQLQHIEQQSALMSAKDAQMQQVNLQVEQLKQSLKLSQLEKKQMLCSKPTSEIGIQVPQILKTIDDIQLIKAEIRFKLRRRWVKQDEIPSRLLTGVGTSFNNMKDRLQEYPFTLSIEQAHEIALYLLTPEDSDLARSHTVESTTLGVLKSRAKHLLQPYELVSPMQEAIIFNAITRKFAAQSGSLLEILKQVKRQEKSSIPLNFCSVQQLRDATKVIFEDGFTTKEIDYIHQISYESTGSTKYIDLPIVFSIFQMGNLNVEQIRKPLFATPSQTMFRYNRDATMKVQSSGMKMQMRHSINPSITDFKIPKQPHLSVNSSQTTFRYYKIKKCLTMHSGINSTSIIHIKEIQSKTNTTNISTQVPPIQHNIAITQTTQHHLSIHVLPLIVFDHKHRQTHSIYSQTEHQQQTRSLDYTNLQNINIKTMTTTINMEVLEKVDEPIQQINQVHDSAPENTQEYDIAYAFAKQYLLQFIQSDYELAQQIVEEFLQSQLQCALDKH